MNNILFFVELIVSFLPFILFVFINSKANVKKENRSRQYAMPVVAVLYSVVLLIFLKKLSELFVNLFLKLADLFEKMNLTAVSEFIRNLYTSWGIYLTLVLFNTAALLLYVIIKRVITAILGRTNLQRRSDNG